MEVEVREENPRDPTALLVNNTPSSLGADGPTVVVRAEEVLLVALVLTIWIGAIALFFNRWGKIRMLEPYQPKFQQSHRPSCPLAPLSPPGITPQQRMSFSKYNVSCLNDSLYPGLPSPNPIRRPRQNSVFVGTSSTMAVMNPPRRVKSAMDIQHLVVNESRAPTLLTCTSMLPMLNLYKDRKPSITIERPAGSLLSSTISNRRRTSTVPVERPLLSHLYLSRNRRPSCCAERPVIKRHRHFISFDQPPGTDRRISVTVERPPPFTHQHHHPRPSISFETPSESMERPFFVVDPPSTSQEYPPTCIADAIAPPFKKTSFSFEQALPEQSEEWKQPRMATSLDMNAIAYGRRSSNSSDRASPVSVHLDEVKITAPLLENLKSSDV